VIVVGAGAAGATTVSPVIAGVVIIGPVTGAKGRTVGAITGDPSGGWEMGVGTAGVMGEGARAVPGVCINGFDSCNSDPNKLRRNGLN
jgi:hypothetical protein